MRRIRPPLLPLAACLGVLGAPVGHAVEYALDGNALLGQQFNSNITLAPGSQAVWGTNIDLDGKLSAGEPNWQVSGRVRLNNYFYAPVSGIDMQNQYVDGGAFYLTDRSRYDLAGNFTDDYILSSQSDPGLGLVLGKVGRTSKNIGPTWTYSFSEKTQGAVGYSYTQAEYSGSVQSYPDSETHAGFAQLTHRHSERLTVEGAASYSSYTGELARAGYKNSIRYTNLSVGLKYAVNQDLDVRLSVGGQFSQSESQFRGYRLLGYTTTFTIPPRLVPVIEPVTLNAPARDSFGPVFTLSATQRFERSTLNLAYNRQINPSINGALMEFDSLNLTANRELRPGCNASLALSYNHQTYPNASNGTQDYSYYRAEGSLSYAWSRRWSSVASYRYYLRQSGDNAVLEQDSHTVVLTLKYDFDPQTF